MPVVVFGSTIFVFGPSFIRSPINCRQKIVCVCCWFSRLLRPKSKKRERNARNANDALVQIARQLTTGWRRSPCPRLRPRTCTTHSLGRLTSQLASGRQYSLVLASDDEREDTTPHSLLFQVCVCVCQHSIMFSCCCCNQTRSICHAGKLI